MHCDLPAPLQKWQKKWSPQCTNPDPDRRHRPCVDKVYPVVIEEPSPAFLKRKLCIVFPDCGVGHLLAVLCTGRGAVRLTPKAAKKTHRHPSGSAQSLGSRYRRPQWGKIMSGSLETQHIMLFNSAPPFAISRVTVKTPRPQKLFCLA